MSTHMTLRHHISPLLLLGATLGLLLTQFPIPCTLGIALISIYMLVSKEPGIKSIVLLFLTIATLSPVYLTLRSPVPAPPPEIATSIHKKLIDISQKTLPQPFANLNISLVFGDSDITLPPSIKEAFQKTGLTHLLVVSGAQVSLLCGILLTLLESTPLPPIGRFLIITLCTIIFFFVTGGEASILRAVIMSEIAIGIKLLQRNANIYHLLSLTALIMLIINPHNLTNIGAHLSFLATVALIYAAPKIESRLPQKNSKMDQSNHQYFHRTLAHHNTLYLVCLPKSLPHGIA